MIARRTFRATVLFLVLLVPLESWSQNHRDFHDFVAGAEELVVPGETSRGLPKVFTILYSVPSPLISEVFSKQQPVGIQGRHQTSRPQVAQIVGHLERATHSIYIKKGMMTEGDDFHSSLLTLESPLDGKSSLIGIFEGVSSDPSTYDKPVATLRVAIPVWGRTPLMVRSKLSYEDLFGRNMNNEYIQRYGLQ